jgi:4-oxalocrotonate tautomerase
MGTSIWALTSTSGRKLRLAEFPFQFSFCTGSDSVPELAAPPPIVGCSRPRNGPFPAAAGKPARERTVIMPLVDVQLIEGVFDKSHKQEMIRKITDAMVEIEGEAMRGVTWVRVHEVASGNWGIGGRGLTTADVKALQASGK